VLRGITVGMFPATFPGQADPVSGNRVWVGAVPAWIGGGGGCGVGLGYGFWGGVRGGGWA
jgi:hypothetical protein